MGTKKGISKWRVELAARFSETDKRPKNVLLRFPLNDCDIQQYDLSDIRTDISKRFIIKVDYTKMAKKYRYWKVKIKEVNNPSVITTGMYGPYELEDVRAHFGLDAPDVEWYTIEEEKGGKE